MNVTESKDGKMIAVGLEPEEKLLESIKEVIKTYHIQDGVVISGVGTLKRCQMHYVDTTSFPAKNVYYVVEEPLEVGSISGLIADYEPHLHMVAGCRDKKTYSGHLEDGCIVLYLAEVLIMRISAGLRREVHPKFGVALLKGRS